MSVLLANELKRFIRFAKTILQQPLQYAAVQLGSSNKIAVFFFTTWASPLLGNTHTQWLMAVHHPITAARVISFFLRPISTRVCAVCEWLGRCVPSWNVTNFYQTIIVRPHSMSSGAGPNLIDYTLGDPISEERKQITNKRHCA